MKSPRMERVLALLKERGSRGATGMDITDISLVVSPRDYIRRLRSHGHDIQKIEDGATPTGGRIVRYVLRSPSPGAAQGDLFSGGMRPCHRCKALTVHTSDWGATCEACDREISLMDSGA